MKDTEGSLSLGFSEIDKVGLFNYILVAVCTWDQLMLCRSLWTIPTVCYVEFSVDYSLMYTMFSSLWTIPTEYYVEFIVDYPHCILYAVPCGLSPLYTVCSSQWIIPHCILCAVPCGLSPMIYCLQYPVDYPNTVYCLQFPVDYPPWYTMCSSLWIIPHGILCAVPCESVNYLPWYTMCSSLWMIPSCILCAVPCGLSPTVYCLWLAVLFLAHVDRLLTTHALGNALSLTCLLSILSLKLFALC